MLSSNLRHHNLSFCVISCSEYDKITDIQGFWEYDAPISSYSAIVCIMISGCGREC